MNTEKTKENLRYAVQSFGFLILNNSALPFSKFLELITSYCIHEKALYLVKELKGFSGTVVRDYSGIKIISKGLSA